MQVLFFGRAPRTKETLPDFLKWRRVTQPPLVFRGLTGSQRTPGFWGVTCRLVNLVEKSGFKNVQKLLEISKRERHHEILLTVRNLRELSHNPSPSILPVIPHALPSKIEQGEHYFIVDLLNLAPSSSSPTQTFEIQMVRLELVVSLRPEQPSLAREDSGPTP